MRLRRIEAAGVFVVVAGMLGACGQATEPSPSQRRLGILQLDGYRGPLAVEEASDDRDIRWDHEPTNGIRVSPEVLVVPETVVAGKAFDVTVHTIGANGCWQSDGQEVRVTAGMVELVPYDVHSGAESCPDNLPYLSHTSSLTLESPGEWVIRVCGRRVRHGDSSWELPVTAEKTIVVR